MSVPPGVAHGVERDARLDDPRIADILARFDALGGMEGFCEAVRHANYCRRPLRLQGKVVRVVDGKSRVVFNTRTLPDQVLLKACGSRRETLCPSCASIYRGDAFQLVAAGLRGGKGVPESVAEHPAVLVTLTAPSFGPVHRRQRDGRCHPKRRMCPHQVSLRCTKHHDEGDPTVGQALCASCHDYEGAVLFNLTASELFRRTTIYTLRAVGELAGLSVREVAKVVRLSYVKVVEFQRRGVVHVHAILRLDGVGDGLEPPPPLFDAELLAEAVAVAVRKVHAPLAEQKGPAARRVRWGSQVDVTPISDVADRRRRAAAYLAKYSTKSSDASGALDHRLRAGVRIRGELAPQMRRLVATAWALGEAPAYRELGLRAWAHTLGFRGHFATKSRRYSTTFGKLRVARHEWRQSQEEDPDRADSLEFSEWKVVGTGFSTAGDAWLAAGMAREARTVRIAAIEDRTYEWRRAA